MFVKVVVCRVLRGRHGAPALPFSGCPWNALPTTQPLLAAPDLPAAARVIQPSANLCGVWLS